MTDKSLIIRLLLIFMGIWEVMSVPNLTFPFKNQLPPIARVGENYLYTLAPNTFSSKNGAITYSIQNKPDWLSFDSTSQTFSGYPTISSNTEVETIWFDIVASDNEGSATDNSSITITSYSSPSISKSYSVLSQLSSIGLTDGYRGLVLVPGQSFDIQFSNQTFVPSSLNHPIQEYYGRSLDHSPLPPWISFDSSSLTFYGIAPAVNSGIAPSIEYSFAMMGTDINGYEGIEAIFSIIVGAHQISTNITLPVSINTTRNEFLSHNIPLNLVFSDGEKITKDNITNIILSSQNETSISWLSVINDNDTITGITPSSEEKINFDVKITDLYGNSISLPFQLAIIGSIFAVTSIPDLNVTKGEWFNYTIPSSYLSDDAENVRLSYNADDDSWLSFNDQNNTFYGTVPKDFASKEIIVTGTSSNDQETLSFKVFGVSASDSTSTPIVTPTQTSSRSSSTTTSSSSTTATHKASNKHSNNKKTLTIALGIILPIIFIAVVSLILWFCCIRKLKDNKHDEEATITDGPLVNEKYISSPILTNPSNGTAGGSNRSEFSNKSPHQLEVIKYLNDSTEKMINNSNDQVIHHEIKPSVGSGSDTSIYQDTVEELFLSNIGNNNAKLNTEVDITQPSIVAPLDLKNKHIPDEEPNYQQSPEQKGYSPRRSWRQILDSRSTWQPRESMNSLATVSTTELFGIRKVDSKKDSSQRKQSENSSFRESEFLGTNVSAILSPRNSAGTLLRENSSGNVKRLDSYGNIIVSSKQNLSYDIIHNRELTESSIVPTIDITVAPEDRDPITPPLPIVVKDEHFASKRISYTSFDNESVGDYSGDEIDTTDLHKYGVPMVKSKLKSKYSVNNLGPVKEESFYSQNVTNTGYSISSDSTDTHSYAIFGESESDLGVKYENHTLVKTSETMGVPHSESNETTNTNQSDTISPLRQFSNSLKYKQSKNVSSDKNAKLVDFKNKGLTVNSMQDSSKNSDLPGTRSVSTELAFI